ncbi:MAG: spondin domain-containing protein [Endozoicomonas sp.]
MKKDLLSLLAAGSLMLSSTATMAAEYEVTVTNLTRGIYFTPLLVAAHDDATGNLFTVGQPASDNLQAMAEGGSIAGLVAELNSASADLVENPASGLLAPGKSATARLSTEGNPDHTLISLVGMMLPTNDSFIGLNAMPLPSGQEVEKKYSLNAYDAGTEANDEIRGSGVPGESGFPVPPPLESLIDNGGTGVNATVEGYVHIHRNVLGDSNPTGGISDINSTTHRWLNPVARVTIEVINP